MKPVVIPSAVFRARGFPDVLVLMKDAIPNEEGG